MFTKTNTSFVSHHKYLRDRILVSGILSRVLFGGGLTIQLLELGHSREFARVGFGGHSQLVDIRCDASVINRE